MASEAHFLKMIDIYRTTRRVFEYWLEKMNKKERLDLCEYLGCEFEYSTVLEKIKNY